MTFRNSAETGEPELVCVVGGGTYCRENYSDEDAFWTDIHAANKRAWEADPHNPDPLGGLFRHVSKHGKRLGEERG